MTHLGRLVVVGAVALLAGCGPAGSEVLEGEDTSPLSPEQLEALVSHIPVPDEGMVRAFAEACQPTSTNSCVNAGYGACTNWSAIYDCGQAPSCNLRGCWKCFSDGTCTYMGSHQYTRNSYRVCFNAAGDTCTEYQLNITNACGCALDLD